MEDLTPVRVDRFMNSPIIKEFWRKFDKISQISKISYGYVIESGVHTLMCKHCSRALVPLVKDKDAFTYTLSEISSAVYMHYTSCHEDLI